MRDSVDSNVLTVPHRATRLPAGTVWAAPPRRPRLCRGQLHVWRGRLDLPRRDLDGLLRTLSVDELVRAGRFVRDADRDHFVAARGFLRAVLGSYLELPPASVGLEYGSWGKPFVAGIQGAPGFNLSHSGEWVVCAVGPARWLGVDIERVRSDFDPAELADMLSPSERLAVEQLPEEDRVNAFFEIWTRKEALAKAVGGGVSIPLERLEVGLGRGAAGLIRASTHPIRTWWLSEVLAGPGYAGAIAVQGTHWSLRRWEGPPLAEAPRGFSRAGQAGILGDPRVNETVA